MPCFQLSYLSKIVIPTFSKVLWTLWRKFALSYFTHKLMMETPEETEALDPQYVKNRSASAGGLFLLLQLANVGMLALNLP